jgi:iron complex outermembrane recepter protein
MMRLGEGERCKKKGLSHMSQYGSFRRTCLLVGAGILSLSIHATSFAQADENEALPATDLPNEAERGSNEIIVTATKREQTLQDVPVAVSVTTAQTIERAQIRDIRDLASVVPSLRVSDRQSAQNATFFIRGFGNGANNLGIEPSVGTFIDGVYRSRTASSIADLPDVQRIEVLRGPQSTLFGKNASAGVISVITKEPEFRFGGNVEISYGNYDAVVAKGRVTGPLSETVALSLAGGINKRRGYIEDLGTGNQTNERDRWFLRGQALFEPSDSLKVRIIGDYGKIDEICCGVVNLVAGPSTQALISPLIGGRVNPPGNAFGDVVYNNFDSINKIENYGVSGQVDWRFGPATLTSITAYRRTNSITNQDSDFTSADLLGQNFQDAKIDTFTQELRLNANFLDKFNILLGAFYFNEKIDQANEIQWGTQARAFAEVLGMQLLGGPFGTNLPTLEGLFGQLSGNPALYSGNNRFFLPGQGLSERYRLENEAITIFGQVDYAITDRLTVTGGLSYTHDAKDFSANVQSTDVFAGVNIPALVQVGANFNLLTPTQQAQLLSLSAFQFFPPFRNVPNAVEPGRTRDNNVSYTARLAYDATDQINVYASIASGFKASSINLTRDSRPTAADRAALISQGLGVTNLGTGSRFAGPEDSTVYELGLKANWGVASANVAVFKQIIKGFQSNIFLGTGFFLANAGKQSVFGIEFEGTVKPAPGLTLGLAMTYLDPKYDEFPQSAFGDASGFTPADIPSISATWSIDYEHRLANEDRIIFHGDFHYESPTQLVEGLPGFLLRDPVTRLVIPGSIPGALAAALPYTREVQDLNLSVTYAMRNGLELSAWGRNVLDDRYLSLIFDSPAQTGSISGYPNQPRTYGVSARYRW